MRAARTTKGVARRLVIGVALVLLAAGCGLGDGDRGAQVVTDDGRAPNRSSAEFALAAASSYARDDTATQRVTPDGVTLAVDARYFEPLTLPGWTAPEECAFNTLVDVTVDGQPWASPAFDGPTDAYAVDRDGFLGGVLPVTAPETGEPAFLVLVVGFSQHTVLSVGLAAPVDSPYAGLDTQPADGWSPLGLLVPAGADADPEAVDVVVTSQGATGEPTTTTLSVPPAADGSLAVLTPTWVFDEAAVGSQCEPPPGTTEPLNQPLPPDTDLLGGTIGDQPVAPQPGEQPDDPTAATAAALEAFRTVYDISDMYDEGKLAHLENPELAARILDEIRAGQIVEPYMGNLDPVFDSVVFTSPTEASILYRVGPSYHWEIGRVLLIDGTWRLALGTFCRDLADAIYTCPGVQPDPGPSPLG